MPQELPCSLVHIEGDNEVIRIDQEVSLRYKFTYNTGKYVYGVYADDLVELFYSVICDQNDRKLPLHNDILGRIFGEAFRQIYH